VACQSHPPRHADNPVPVTHQDRIEHDRAARARQHEALEGEQVRYRVLSLSISTCSMESVGQRKFARHCNTAASTRSRCRRAPFPRDAAAGRLPAPCPSPDHDGEEKPEGSDGDDGAVKTTGRSRLGIGR